MADNTRCLMPYGKVLVVDDMEQNLCVATELMKLYQLQIETAGGGLEAIEKIETKIAEGKAYDIIFMDHMMPEIDGVETTTRIRSMGYTQPVVALTADENDANQEFLAQNGFDDYILKPIDIRKLDIVLNKFISGGVSEEVKTNPEEHADSSKTLTALLKGIDGLDVKKGLQKYEGNPEIYLRILHSFAVNARPMIEKMGEVEVNQENLKSYEIKVHGFKGMSYDIFANHAGDKAKSLEFAAKDGDLDYIKANNLAFLEIARNIIKNIEKMVENVNALNPKPQKSRPDEEMLRKLADSCKVYDMTEADSAMDEINKYQYTDDDGLVEWLIQKVEMVEYKAVASRISDLLALLN